MNNSNGDENVGMLQSSSNRFGFYSAVFTVVITVVTFNEPVLPVHGSCF